MGRPRKAEQEDGTTKRIPFGGNRLKLQLSDEDRNDLLRKGWLTRWFNDQHGRIQRAQSGGYVFVTPEEAPSVCNIALHEGNTDIGDKVSQVVSRSEPVVRAYLMKIKKKYYDEDQKAKNAQLDKTDEALRAGNAGGAFVENQYGKGVTYTR